MPVPLAGLACAALMMPCDGDRQPNAPSPRPCACPVATPLSLQCRVLLLPSLWLSPWPLQPRQALPPHGRRRPEASQRHADACTCATFTGLATTWSQATVIDPRDRSKMTMRYSWKSEDGAAATCAQHYTLWQDQ